jgi:hypothetical protein
VNKVQKLIVRKTGSGIIGSRRAIELEEGTGVTITCTDEPTYQRVRVKIDATGGSSDHAALSNLDWLSSGHEGTPDTAPVFDPAGAAAEVSGSPGQVLGWLPSGALGALSVAVLTLSLSGGVECFGENNWVACPVPVAYVGGTFV